MSALSRSFSRREKALLFLLAMIIVIAAYYFMVHLPCTEAINEAKSQQEQISAENEALQAKAAKKDKMQAELDELMKDPALQEVPKYDNLGAVTGYLDSVMIGTISYDIKCGDVKYDDKAGVYRRPVTVKCNLSGYREAEKVIENIKSCPFLSQISNVTVAPYTRKGYQKLTNIEDGEVNLTFSMNFYEGK